MALESRAAAGLAFCALLLHAQVQVREVVIRTHPYTPPSAVLHAEATLVETGLTVRDSRGRAIPGLTASDFEVLDDGIPRPIAAFSELHSDGQPASPAPSNSAGPTPPAEVSGLQPKFITFFFDDFHVANGGMLFVKQAAHTFIAKGLKPSDRLSIVTASGQGDLDFTDDPKRFADRLEHLSSHARPVVPGACGVSPIDSYIFVHNLDGDIREAAIKAAEICAGCSNSDMPGQCRAKAVTIAQQAASTAWEQMQAQSLDTIFALGFAVKRLSEVKGTRILVVTSSGFLLRPGAPPEMQSLLDAALRGNIVVHAIGAQGLEAYMSGPKGFLRHSLYLMPLENITDGTGGHYFRDTNDLAGAMDLAINPEVSYLLAFRAGSPDGKFHNLKIRFQTKRSATIQFRPGYFSPDPKKEQSPRARLDDTVFSKQTLRGIPVVVAISTGPAKDGSIPLSIGITVDLNQLQFATANDRHVQQLVFLTTLLDTNGGLVTGKESVMDLALTDQKLESLKKDGLKAVATLTAPAGTYQVRTIVREGLKGSLAALTTPVELRAL
ncbi:MAG TPA: VWA domain-containing protein [Bryobacteraceae bacterium]|jgi:VWFA-related protein|nr:VWA domain-containing protein [Bryobacteraceae bacterium]